MYSTGIHPGSGNVFADLGFPEPEEHLRKAELARKICASMEHRGLNQVEAAKLLGTDQPKISALMRGRLSGFSLERLIRFLRRLDWDVSISARPRPSTAEKSREGAIVESPLSKLTLSEFRTTTEKLCEAAKLGTYSSASRSPESYRHFMSPGSQPDAQLYAA